MDAKNLITGLVAVLVSVVLVGVFFSPNDGMNGANGINGTDGLAAIPGDTLYNEFSAIGGFRHTEKVVNYAPTSVYSTTTLQLKDSGTTYSHSASGTTYILPAVSQDGVNFRFVVGGATDSGNIIVDSAEGDNMEGTLIVAGAVVDCAAEDQLNFVVDGENIGDYVEVRSNGTNWLIGDSGVLTAAKLTCTDPS